MLLPGYSDLPYRLGINPHPYRLGINPQANQKSNPLKRVETALLTCFSRFGGLAAWELIPRRNQLRLPAASDLPYRLGINSQANQEPNPLKRVKSYLLTCFSRFEGLAAWELIPRRNGSSR
jgi:hypothetical protein